MAMSKVSEISVYNIGNKGQPCRTPRSRLKASDTNPLMQIWLAVFVYKVLIQLINASPKSKFLRTLNMKPLFTLSKAFDWSRDTIIASGLFCLFAKKMVSWGKIMFSNIALPFMPQGWSRWMMVTMHFLSLLARHFARILKSTFRSEIGLQFLTFNFSPSYSRVITATLLLFVIS